MPKGYLQTEIPKLFDYEDSKLSEDSLNRWLQRMSQTGGGLLGLGLGPGTRERVSESLQGALKPIQPLLPFASALGFNVPYSRGNRSAYNALTSSRADVPEGMYEYFRNKLMGGQFETPEGVRQPQAGPYGYDERAQAANTLAQMGVLPGLSKSNLSRGDIDRVNRTIGNYLQAAGALGERTGASASQNLRALREGGLLGHVNPEKLKDIVRMQQIRNRRKR